MTYLLDTCVISETRSKKPDSGLVEWMSHQNPDSLYMSAISIGEIEKGICILGNTKRARELSDWLAKLQVAFGRRILSVNASVAECWGRLLAENARVGRPRPAIDALIAATAKIDGHVLVTRNVRDMQGMGVEIINPFSR